MPEKGRNTKSEQSEAFVKSVVETAKKLGLNVFIVCGGTFGSHHNGEAIMGDEKLAQRMWRNQHSEESGQ